ncbi:MAG: hypothetical protein IKF58_15125 [Bacillus sp. (in: Bacteria)]|nr:hypothetical protein [Bacillus sp. (in: firmicutes)]
MTKKTITVYSKHCFKCLYGEQYNFIRNWAYSKGYNLEIKRTAYRPAWHKEATELWGGEDYNVIVVGERGGAMSLENFLDKCRNKAVRSGKKKGAKKSGVQGLRKAKRSSRASSVADKKTEAKVENEVKDVK